MTAGRKNIDTVQHWCTPPHYVEAIRSFFGGTIELDPCSNSYSIVGAKVELSLPKFDGLKAEWKAQSIFVNPPYGADRNRGTTIKNWLAKCLDANRKYNSEVVALVPVATNTRHWKDYVWGHATAIAFLFDTRLKFLVNGSSDTKGAPMSCALVYWGPRVAEFDAAFSEFGVVVDLRDQSGRRFGRGKQIELV